MSDYNKVKAVVYKKVPNSKNRLTRTTLNRLDLVKINDYEEHVNQMEIDGLIEFDWEMGQIEYSSVKITTKGNTDLYNY